MRTDKNILVAFLLNFFFAVLELLGGLFTGSVAILSDALHDMGDALSIGVSFALEKKSKKAPDGVYTYGYARYSVLGSVFTTLILLVGSVLVAYHAVNRLLVPTEIHYDGMIVLAVVGVGVNLAAALLTHEGHSLNQRAVNLHMLEDTLGWVVVLVGALVMRWTDIRIIDPLMSLGLAVFIAIGAIKNLKEALDLFLEKTPAHIKVNEICEHVRTLEGVVDVHHVHLWSLDGQRHYATMHVVTDADAGHVKSLVRQELAHHGIGHITVETESTREACSEERCCPEVAESNAHHHHHHHHHHH